MERASESCDLLARVSFGASPHPLDLSPDLEPFREGIRRDRSQRQDQHLALHGPHPISLPDRSDSRQVIAPSCLYPPSPFSTRCVQKLRRRVVIENYRRSDSLLASGQPSAAYTLPTLVTFSGLSVSDPQPLTHNDLAKEGIPSQVFSYSRGLCSCCV
jgi:hypothetical protein